MTLRAVGFGFLTAIVGIPVAIVCEGAALDKKYTGTPGLWEIIVKSHPVRYINDDRNKYKEILDQTDEIRSDLNSAKPRSSRSYKYTNVIKPIWEEIIGKSGKGVVILPSDPNALFDMLKLRLSALQAGNTGARNETVAICDELLRQGQIDDDEYKGITLSLSRAQLKHNTKVNGGYLPLLGLIGSVIASKVVPAIATGLLTGTAAAAGSTIVNKIAGNGEKILEDLVVEVGLEDNLYSLSYLIFDEKRLELRRLERRLEEKSCLITEERMNQLRFEDEMLEDLEERFNSRSELVFDQERMNQLQNIVGPKKIIEKLEVLILRKIEELEENIPREIEMLEELDERIEAIRLDDNIKLVLDGRLEIKRLERRLYEASM
nr:unnamed protein product [Hydra vulgaris]